MRERRCAVLVLVVATLTVRSEALRGEAAAAQRPGRRREREYPDGRGDARHARPRTRTTPPGHRQLGGPLARVVPVVAQQQRFLAGALRAASSAAAVGRREVSAIDPHARVHPGPDRPGPTSEALTHPMRILDRQLHTTDAAAGGAQFPLAGRSRCSDRATSFRRQLAQATRSADLGVQATAVVPAMLGADGTRHYLIAFMTPSESRGYDGLIGSYGLLSAQGGHIVSPTSGNITNLQDALPKGGAHLTGVAALPGSLRVLRPGQRTPRTSCTRPTCPPTPRCSPRATPRAWGTDRRGPRHRPLRAGRPAALHRAHRRSPGSRSP